MISEIMIAVGIIDKPTVNVSAFKVFVLWERLYELLVKHARHTVIMEREEVRIASQVSFDKVLYFWDQILIAGISRIFKSPQTH